MRHLISVAILAVALPAAAPLPGQQTGLAQMEAASEVETRITPARDIQQSARYYENRVVTVKGMVDRYLSPADQGAATDRARFFLLRDEYGDLIMVRTTARMPDQQVMYSVTGSVSLSAQGQPYVVEEQRKVHPLEETTSLARSEAEAGTVGQKALKADETPQPLDLTSPAEPLPPVEAPAEPSRSSWGWVLLVSAAVAGGALLWYLARRSRSRPGSLATGAKLPSSGTGPFTGPATPTRGAVGNGNGNGAEAPAEAARGAQLVEDRTVRFFTPPPGTIKVLRGKLDVEGPEKNTIRFFALPTNDGTNEFTFGRQEGEPYRHIQLKIPSVSRVQAKVRIRDGAYEIHNESTTNPTRVNGAAIDAWVPLREGDRVEMGESAFVFHDA